MSSPYSPLSSVLCSNSLSAFRIENSSGNGFGLSRTGPNAMNVPKEAIIVDNSSPDVVFSNPSMWSSADDAQYYRKSLAFTAKAGASLSFSFEGVAIWYCCVLYTWNVHANLFLRYYSDQDTDHGFYTVSLDDSEPERLDGRNDGGQLTQLMLWSKTNLTPGKHNFTLRHDDFGGTYIALDFFRSVTIEATE